LIGVGDTGERVTTVIDAARPGDHVLVRATVKRANVPRQTYPTTVTPVPDVCQAGQGMDAKADQVRIRAPVSCRRKRRGAVR
jgi:hypothetical protein